MRLISDERRALVIKDKARRLSTRREGDFHLAFSRHVVDITIRRDEV